MSLFEKEMQKGISRQKKFERNLQKKNQDELVFNFKDIKDNI